MTITTGVGEVEVLHRLALAVECVDAVTRRVVTTPVRIGRERGTLAAARGDPSWPCLEFVARGSGRAMLLHRPRAPKAVTVRIVDPVRRWVPRRLTLRLWTEAEVSAADTGTGSFVPTGSRLLRPWLLPGSAYPITRGTTAIRGRVSIDGVGVRWPRIVATGPGAVPVGWAHGDERGEFVLIVESTGLLPPPAPDTIALSLTVSARAVTEPPTDDPLADLVVERVLRSAAPPTPTAAEIRLLRGRLIPPQYVTSLTHTPLTVPIGTLTTLAVDVPFGT